MEWIKKFLSDESGATAVEYGIMVAGISVAVIATVYLLGTQLNSFFETVRGFITTP